MREGRGLLVAAALVAAGMSGAAAILLARQPGADASALSRDSLGWVAARRYLEERGARVTLLDRELDDGPPPRGAVLAIAFPWQTTSFGDLPAALDRHLQTGGAVVFAYGDSFDPHESMVADALGLTWGERRRKPPLNPLRWRAYADEEWSLTPEPSRALRPARVAARLRAPRAPKGATVLFRDPSGREAAFVFPRGRGRVAVIPADTFANARVSEPGNADLLETLLQDLGGSWAFDEFHHGLRAAAGPAETGPQDILLLYLAQVGFLYGLAALAVARRFGPAWREPAVASGSAATFLIGLGALHHRLRHHREASALLLERAQELGTPTGPADLPAEDAKGFLEMARRVGAAQSRRGSNA